MDIDNSDISETDFEDDIESFVSLAKLDETFKKDPFVFAFNSYSMFENKKGIITIISLDEIINLKVNIQYNDNIAPLKFKKDPTRIIVEGDFFTY